jgi:hypothetical protein
MCFSAPASFAVAAGTGLVGALTVAKVSNWREIPLASVPLMFATQQTVEGVLWLLLPAGSEPALIGLLANMFAFYALVIWPVLSPLAIGLVEQDRLRRLAMTMLFALAIPLALFNLRDIAAHPYGACIVQYSISYSNGTAYSLLGWGAYIVCVCCPLLFSSHGILRVFGALVVAGLGVSAFFFIVTSFSVWCFFAAAGSVTVYLYFAATSEHVAEARRA